VERASCDATAILSLVPRVTLLHPSYDCIFSLRYLLINAFVQQLVWLARYQAHCWPLFTGLSLVNSSTNDQPAKNALVVVGFA
jgi:hypothetical protein